MNIEATTMVPSEEVAQVGSFASAVYELNDIVEVRCLPGGVSTWHTAGDLVDQIADWRTKNAKAVNVFVGANPRIEEGAKSDKGVLLARCIFADFDNVTVEQALAKIATK